MPTLHIDFREGFLDDAVVVRVNSEEYHKHGVRTRLQTGYAGSLEVDVRENLVHVEVVLTSRDYGNPLASCSISQILFTWDYRLLRKVRLANEYRTSRSGIYNLLLS